MSQHLHQHMDSSNFEHSHNQFDLDTENNIVDQIVFRAQFHFDQLVGEKVDLEDWVVMVVD